MAVKAHRGGDNGTVDNKPLPGATEPPERNGLQGSHGSQAPGGVEACRTKRMLDAVRTNFHLLVLQLSLIPFDGEHKPQSPHHSCRGLSDTSFLINETCWRGHGALDALDSRAACFEALRSAEALLSGGDFREAVEHLRSAAEAADGAAISFAFISPETIVPLREEGWFWLWSFVHALHRIALARASLGHVQRYPSLRLTSLQAHTRTA